MVLLGRSPYLGDFSMPGKRDREAAARAMKLAGITHLIGKSCGQLSGGELQLVLIARALAQQPKVLVMDEPTASLDFGNQHMVLDQMKKLTESGTAVVMVTHDPNHALFCADKVIVMHRGRIIQEGSPDAVMTDDCLQSIYSARARIVEVCVAPGVTTKTCIPLMAAEG
jgi:iron complex transport system ATP-binding protein